MTGAYRQVGILQKYNENLGEIIRVVVRIFILFLDLRSSTSRYDLLAWLWEKKYTYKTKRRKISAFLECTLIRYT